MKTIPLKELLAKATPRPIRTDCLPLIYVLVKHRRPDPPMVNLWSAQVQPDNAFLDRDGCSEIAALLAHAANNIGPLVEALEAVLGDDWRMSCDWGPRDERDAIMERARKALAAAKEVSL